MHNIQGGRAVNYAITGLENSAHIKGDSTLLQLREMESADLGRLSHTGNILLKEE